MKDIIKEIESLEFQLHEYHKNMIKGLVKMQEKITVLKEFLEEVKSVEDLFKKVGK